MEFSSVCQQMVNNNYNVIILQMKFSPLIYKNICLSLILYTFKLLNINRVPKMMIFPSSLQYVFVGNQGTSNPENVDLRTDSQSNGLIMIFYAPLNPLNSSVAII